MSETLTAEQRLIQAVLRWDELEMIGAASDPACCDNCTALTELRESVDAVRGLLDGEPA